MRLGRTSAGTKIAVSEVLLRGVVSLGGEATLVIDGANVDEGEVVISLDVDRPVLLAVVICAGMVE